MVFVSPTDSPNKTVQGFPTPLRRDLYWSSGGSEIMFESQALRLTLLIVVLASAGCGLTRDRIVVSYTPMPGVQRVPGAEAIGVRVQAVDARAHKQDVGRKRWENRPEYDFGGAILAQDDLAALIGQAIQSELSSRSFRQPEGSVVVVAELIKFYNEFKGFPEKSVAEVIMNVQVQKPDGEIVFAKTVTGQGTQSLIVVEANFGGVLRSGSNAKVALEGALSDAMLKLLNHTDFIGALLQAGAAK